MKLLTYSFIIYSLFTFPPGPISFQRVSYAAFPNLLLSFRSAWPGKEQWRGPTQLRTPALPWFQDAVHCRMPQPLNSTLFRGKAKEDSDRGVLQLRWVGFQHQGMKWQSCIIQAILENLSAYKVQCTWFGGWWYLSTASFSSRTGEDLYFSAQTSNKGVGLCFGPKDKDTLLLLLLLPSACRWIQIRNRHCQCEIDTFLVLT